MGRRAKIEFAAIKSSLVNLPLSLYGPLVERQVRPQQLAVHLSLVDGRPTPDGSKRKLESYVGWTGMPAASSLARLGNASGGSDLETIEMDPLFAEVVGFKRGDTVEIGLVHDMLKATTIHAEPLAADDWDIIELHAAQLENTLLSQARVASVGQPLVAWVLGRTPVKLRITSVTSSGDSKLPALFGTDTEFIVAPKLRRGHQTRNGTEGSQFNGTPDKALKSDSAQPERVLLRVIASPLEQTPPSEAKTIRAYLSRPTFSHLSGCSLSDLIASFPDHTATKHHEEEGVYITGTTIHIRAGAFKRLEHPKDPTAPAPDSNEIERQDPLSLSLAQAASVKAKEKEVLDKPKFELACCPDAQVRVPILEEREEGRAPKWKVRPIELAMVPDACVAVPRSVLGERSGLNVGDMILISVDGSGKVKQVEEEVRLSTTVVDTNVPNLAGVTEELKAGHLHLLAKFAVHARKQRSIQGASGLLIMGNAGTGKTSVAKAVADILHTDLRAHAYTHYIDCSKLVDKPVSTLKSLFQYWFDLCAFHRPTVLVLDDLDKLLPAEQEHAPSYRSRQLAALFLGVFGGSARSIPRDARAIGIIVTARSAVSLHPSLRASHLFQEEIQLGRMSKEGRRDVLALTVRLRVESSNGQLSAPNLNIAAIAATTEGYAPTDLKDLVGRAVHRAAVRCSQANVEEPPTLTFADFEKAKEGFVPVSLRDVPLQTSQVAWTDIGGLTEPRRILRETLEWPTKYARIFAQSPLRLRSGLLLYGYPGCGKTLLASAVAKECGLNFVGVKGPEILNKYIGASEASVRELFERASAARPCVLFFDEFDSIAPKRGHDSTGVTDRVVNQMLTQMDGAEGLEGVYVLAATSRPDLIDSALLRPGRLDKAVLCDMPSHEERKEIFQALSRKVTLSASVDLDALAEKTEGYSGADLQALLYNAHLDVVHDAIAAAEASGTSIRSRPDEGEKKVEYTVLGAKKKQKAVRSRAEEAELQKRLQQMMSSSKDTVTDPKTDANTGPPAQHVVETRHLEKVLRTTKPSVSPTERERLRRIYASFVGDRTGEMPVPPGPGSVGQRVSLM